VLFSMRFLYEFKTITRDSNDGYAKFFFCFVRYGLGKVFQEKTIGKNCKENSDKLQKL
jgi:hypothetical protein